MKAQFTDPQFYYTFYLSDKMFARISNRFVPLLLVLPLLAVASAVPRTDINQCNTGIECCKSTEAVNLNFV